MSQEQAATQGDVPGEGQGRAIVVASWVGTALYTVVAIAGTVASSLVPAIVVVSWVLFAIGLVAFLLGYARAIGRSRYEAIGMGGLFFLVGSAPKAVQRPLLAAFVVQIVVALTTSAIRIYTAVAFGVLVPMYGLGLMGLWAASYGTFPPRER